MLPIDSELQNDFQASCLEGRDQLPIETKAIEILYAIEKHDTTIVIGETGSGKSTKLPQLLLATGRYCQNGKMIGLTLPRRVSVINVAKRLAQNCGQSIGDQVGYAVRFDRQVTQKTKLKALTDGTLLQEMLSDPLLTQYSVLIIDDCHERSMYTDMILGLLKKVRQQRKMQNDDLKIVISSATIDAQKYFDFFNEAPTFRTQVVHVQGRSYPVELFYLDKPTKDYLMQAVYTVKQIHNSEVDPNSGNVLVFLTGKEEIHDFMNKFEQAMKNDHLIDPYKKQSIFCQACYGGMPLTEQVKIFEPAPFNTRKVIVATNIAETSITIDGVAFVVDACLSKVKNYNSGLNLDQLMVVSASKSSCNQRAGRSGRIKPGKCYRLCTQDFFDQNLPQESQPEIERTNPTEMLLKLKGLGVSNLTNFAYLDRGPSKLAMRSSLDLLYHLGAIDEHGQLTEDKGKLMVELSLDPRYTAAVITANGEEYKVFNEVLIIVSLMQFGQQLFSNQSDAISVSKVKKRPHHGAIEGDHITLLNIFNKLYNGQKSQAQRNGIARELRLNQWAWDKANEVRQSLRRQMTKLGFIVRKSDDYDDPQAILKALTIGFFMNIAQRQFDGTYTNLANPAANGLEIHPSSVLSNLKPKLVIYNELVAVSSQQGPGGLAQQRKLMTDVSTIEQDWLFEIVPNGFYMDARKAIALQKHQQAIQSASTVGNKRKFGQTALSAEGQFTAPTGIRGKKGLNLTQSVQMTSAQDTQLTETVGKKASFKFKQPKETKPHLQQSQDKNTTTVKKEKKLIGLSFGDEEDY